jgi:hypothetical protein
MKTLRAKESLIKMVTWMLLVVLFLTACGNKEGPPTPSPEQIFTQIAQEVSAGLTQTAAAKPQIVPSTPPENLPATAPGENPTIAAISTMTGGGPTIAPLPPGPTQNPADLVPTNAVPIVTQADLNTPNCKYRALLAYESPKDEDWIQEKKNFKRIWLFTNVGDCTWPAGTYLRYVSGELFDAEATQIITDVAIAPGERVRVESHMQAPELGAGVGKTTLQGNWMLGTPDGHLFGSGTDGKGYFWVNIVVCEEKTCKTEGT